MDTQNIPQKKSEKVEIDTGELDNEHEIDLDRSGPHEGGEGSEESGNAQEFTPKSDDQSDGSMDPDTTGYY